MGVLTDAEVTGEPRYSSGPAPKPMMIQFNPTRVRHNGPRELTTHELVNIAVSDLHIVCVGVEGDCLYFQKNGSTEDRDTLARQIIERLDNADPRVRLALERAHISNIAIE
jgi:hypothetical protein